MRFNNLWKRAAFATTKAKKPHKNCCVNIFHRSHDELHLHLKRSSTSDFASAPSSSTWINDKERCNDRLWLRVENNFARRQIFRKSSSTHNGLEKPRRSPTTTMQISKLFKSLAICVFHRNTGSRWRYLEEKSMTCANAQNEIRMTLKFVSFELRIELSTVTPDYF